MSYLIIIPNYNGLHLLEKYLPTVLKYAEPESLVIVDDASTDNSVGWLRKNHPAIRVINHDLNKGFAESCNDGAKDLHAKINYLVFLNSDMELCEDFITPCIDILEQDKQVFAVVPQIIRSTDGNKNEAVTIGYFRGGWFTTENVSLYSSYHETNLVRSILWACGGAMVCRAEVFKTLGGFDPIYSPYYVEDLDLSYRAWKAGYKVLYNPAVSVLHHHSSTIGRNKSWKQKLLIRRNQYLFHWRNITDKKMRREHRLMIVGRVLTLQIKEIMAMLWAAKINYGFAGKTQLHVVNYQSKPKQSDVEIIRQSFPNPNSPPCPPLYIRIEGGAIKQ